MRCALCGHEFEINTLACHSSCAFNESCGIICCPNCGYQIPDERQSKMASAFARFLARRRATGNAAPIRPLSTLQAGETGTIVSINSVNHARVERLHVLGLVNEARITLQQRRPAYVVRIGFTELSIDTDIAADIMVDVSA